MTGRAVLCHTVITKYVLNHRTFRDANHISSSILDAVYAKRKKRSLLSRIA